uniref:Tail sheath protein n=1 Tax=Pseudomonas phage Cygsa01 TaxID=3138529 RepID=A0AAU6W379_9VIRU
MVFSVSPSVEFSETDASVYADPKIDVIGGMPGVFQWGPVDAPTLVTGGERGLVQNFYKPNDETYLSFFVAADYLSYSGKMQIVRVAGPAARNAVPGANEPVLVKNDDDAETTQLPGYDFYARYPGALGNGIAVDICGAADYAAWEFKSSFSYTPRVGEFHIAVVDTTGAFSGEGSAQQTEGLTLAGKVSGGTFEQFTLTAAAATPIKAGRPEVVQVQLSGAATGTNVTILGNPVTVNVGEDASVVAGKAEALLKTLPAYASVIRNGATLTVTFTANSNQSPVPNATENGVSKTYSVIQQGNNTAVVTLGTSKVTLTDGATAAETVAAVVAGLTADPLVRAVEVDGLVITAERAPAAAKTAITTYNAGGLVLEYDQVTPANDQAPVTVFGQTVNLADGDTPGQAAAKIAAVITASEEVASATASGATVVYARKTKGRKVKLEGFASTGLVGTTSIRSTGRLGSILEKYSLMNATKGSKHADGTGAYFVDQINRSSQYVRVGDATAPLSTRFVTLSGGVDDNVGVNLSSGFSELANSERLAVDNIIAGAVSVQEQKLAFDTAEGRRDCIAFASPPMEAVVGNRNNEVAAVLDWRNDEFNPDSTYGVMDNNWALIYDKYNDVNRWIPCCGGTAGLSARTTIEGEAWFSPAGYQYGRYKNYIKLAWSPIKDQRDELFQAQVNPIINDLGNGIVLFGDKTSTTRPSSFDAINVRKLFIFLEKTMANMAKFYLFGINDAFTRKQFLAAANPLFRTVQGRRGITDFRIICDESNNPGDAVDRKEMNATFYVKPTLSIRNIYLNFVSVGQSVTFDEVEGV